MSQAKKAELAKILHEENVDVFCIVEANTLDENLKYFEIRDYKLYNLPKTRQIASGILVGIHKDITHKFYRVKEMHDTDKCEIVRIETWKLNNHITIYGLYNPPNNKPDLCSLEINSKTIIIGDFNAHFHTVGYKDTNSAGEEVKELLATSNMELIYNEDDPPTYIHYNGTGTNPDLTIATADLSWNIKRKLIGDPGSGHRMIISSLPIRTRPNRVHKRTKFSWNLKKANWNNFQNHIEKELLQTEFDFEEESSDKNCNKFTQIILKAAKTNIPRGRIRKYKPFWSKKLAELKAERDTLRKKAEITKDSQDVKNWRQKAAKFRKEISEAKKQAFYSFVSKLDYKKDGVKIHRYISTLENKTNIKEKQPLLVKNKFICEDSQIAQEFNKHYTSFTHLPRQLKQKEKSIKAQSKKLGCTTEFSSIFNKDFSSHELHEAIMSLKDKKQPGPDYILAEFIKHLGPYAREICLKLFNQIWKYNIPNIWKKAIIVPILKQNKSANRIDSYRPISLTSILGKTMERMVNSRLTWFLENQNILTPAQAGFRTHQTTTQQILKLTQDIKDSLDKRETTLVVYVDFKDAYGSVWRSKLLEKLNTIGIKGKMIKWIYNFINQRYCATRYADVMSKFKQQRRGLPQGSVISPTLFNIMINDLPSRITKTKDVKCALYADDLAIWTNTPRTQHNKLSENMTKALSSLDEWCYENDMKVNTTKTFYQIFTLQHKKPTIKIFINDVQINQQENQAYLGMFLDQKLNWKEHVQKTAEKANKRCKILKRLAGTKWGCQRSILNSTYKSYIKPVLLYGSENLITANTRTIQKLETVQNHAMRLITGAVKSTPITAMQMFTKNNSIQQEIERLALIQYEKLIRLPHENHWLKYASANRNLKTQNGYIQCVQKIRPTELVNNSIEKLLLPASPLEYTQIEHRTTLLKNFKKAECTTDELKQLVLETIHTLYQMDTVCVCVSE